MENNLAVLLIFLKEMLAVIIFTLFIIQVVMTNIKYIKMLRKK